MLKRLMSILGVGAGPASPHAGQSQLRWGNVATILYPETWQKVKQTNEKAVLRSPDAHQQATISLMYFNIRPNFDAFRELCEVRYKAERQDETEIVIEPPSPQPCEQGSAYIMSYSGSNKKNDRVFSGYLSLADRELITIYLEGISVGPEIHLNSFQQLVKGLKRD